MTAPRVRLIVGAVPEALAEFADWTFDAIATDPPYDLLQTSRRGSQRAENPDSPAGRATAAGGFMGMSWDATGIAFDPATWREVLRVMKPGAFAVVAGGSRTFHRLVCAMEDAGFRIVDCITHLHGQGFPKAGYVDRDRFPGMAGSLKPSVEFWTLAQKPAAGTIAENLAAHGTGALNIDAARTPSGGTHGSAASAGAGSGHGTVAGRGVYRGIGGEVAAPHLAGRWPANVVFSHVAADPETGESGCVRVGTKRVAATSSAEYDWGDFGKSDCYNAAKGATTRGYADSDGKEEVADWRCAPGCPVRLLDEQAGERPVSGAARQGHQRNPSSAGRGSTSIFPLQATGGALHNDFGSATRFFFCTKAASSERWGLCRTCDAVFQFNADPQPAPDCPRHGARQSDFGPLFGGLADPVCSCPPRALDAHAGHDRVLHPTVKPLDLMRWLVRLVVPPGGLLLDCFAGTGSTGVAALAEGARAVLVERDPDYARIAEGRLRAVGA